jgi:hypothetical protein
LVSGIPSSSLRVQADVGCACRIASESIDAQVVETIKNMIADENSSGPDYDFDDWGAA